VPGQAQRDRDRGLHDGLHGELDVGLHDLCCAPDEQRFVRGEGARERSREGARGARHGRRENARFFVSFLSRCAASQILPSGPFFARINWL
jgi:hypothetical protein